MIRWIVLLLTLACALAATASAGAPEGARPAVTALRVEGDGRTARLLVDLDRDVAYAVSTLADPYRIVVDLPAVRWRVELAGGSADLVAAVRFGDFRPEQARIVADLALPATVREARLVPGGDGVRLEIVLAQTDRAGFLAQLSPPQPFGAGPPPARSADGDAPKRPVVMIDPGHGGIDPGAVSRSGLYEKDLVLAYGRALADALAATGHFAVHLTRETDVFLTLSDRVRLAREVDADLLISLHADVIADHAFRGAALYTLSRRPSDAQTAAYAERENGADMVGGVDLVDRDDAVASILIDLAKRDSHRRASRFAKLLLTRLADGVRLRTKPHRQGGFRVLRAPDVPSVLLELGYLSNAEEERFLRSSEGRAVIIAAVARAVDEYFTGRGDGAVRARPLP